MSLNSAFVKKLLLAAGLLVVLVQGLWQLPDLHNYLFPVARENFTLQQARQECPRLEDDLRTLKERVDYLAWFQAHNGPDQRISAARLGAFPFSEAIRPLAPGFFWQTNIRLAHKNRLRAERKLLYLQGLLKNLDENAARHPSHTGPATAAPTAAASSSMQQIQPLHEHYAQYSARLMELTRQLARLEEHGYKQ